jgi:hypothetical protein
MEFYHQDNSNDYNRTQNQDEDQKLWPPKVSKPSLPKATSHPCGPLPHVPSHVEPPGVDLSGHEFLQRGMSTR